MEVRLDGYEINIQNDIDQGQSQVKFQLAWIGFRCGENVNLDVTGV